MILSLPRRHLWLVLVLFWVGAGSLYLWATFERKAHLNLSAAAGGQMPYLLYARGQAQEGIGHYFGDRNRMPLYPALVSLLDDGDWERFYERSVWFTIAVSVVVLLGVGLVAYRLLSPGGATVLLLSAAFCVFLRQASFAQPELLYYGLLFGLWLTLCRLLRRPDWRWAALAGVLAGLAYLTKASALVVLPAYMLVALGQAGLALGQRRAAPTDHYPSVRAAGLSLLIVAALFTLVVYPYVSANKARFGHYFYNVNSTFFMWCDDWVEARDFAERYHLEAGYPQAPAEQLPSAGRYWRTHTVGQVWSRLSYGLGRLAVMVFGGPFGYGKYAVVVLALAALLAVRPGRSWGLLRAGYGAAALFSLLLFVGYLLVYAWYVPIGYGDRFVASLFLPVMFSALWLVERLSAGTDPIPLGRWRSGPVQLVNGVLIALLLLETGLTVGSSLRVPTPEFVTFYYNESRALQRSGNLPEAIRGFEGVIRLDPEVAPAHRDLGMIQLQAGRWDKAVSSFESALRARPDDADLYNSLGSALVQAGRARDALAAFQRAVALAPDFAPAWFNLGGTYCQLGAYAQARQAHARLQQLDPERARQLAELIEP